MMKKKILVGIIVFLIAVVCIVSYVVVKKATTEGIWLGDYKYKYDNSEEKRIIILDYRGTDSYVEFPTKLFMLDVAYVESNVFYRNNNIEKMFIPKEVDYEYIIFQCDSLKEVVFEDGTEEVNVIIKECENLDKIYIPETVTSFPEGFCYGCPKLEDIYISDNVLTVSGDAFFATGLEKKCLDDKYYVVGDGILLFYNGDYGEIIIPNGVKKLNQETLFFNRKDTSYLEAIYFPETITDVGNMEIYEDVTAYFGAEDIDGVNPEKIEGTIVAPVGSYMEQFCKENNLNFRVMTEEEAIWREKTEAAASEITYQE
ncbi:MAG: hypothetical protein E7275_10820 [Pseudobutyrivibrio sp.]|jgi:hypothetical protein|nr:hypothetical protein [Pseudobutyrivibrio sp.]